MRLQKKIFEKKKYLCTLTCENMYAYIMCLQAKVVLNVEFLQCDWLTSGWKFNVFARSQQLNDNFLTKYEVAIFYKLRST